LGGPSSALPVLDIHSGRRLTSTHGRPPCPEGRNALETIETHHGVLGPSHGQGNRTGTEGAITFYGSSFISDPYGRKLVQAPRDEPVVLVADLDLDQRRDWLELFPFLTTRRPDAYTTLVDDPQASENG
jgi:Carbon-nitrogen hydrolase